MYTESFARLYRKYYFSILQKLIRNNIDQKSHRLNINMRPTTPYPQFLLLTIREYISFGSNIRKSIVYGIKWNQRAILWQTFSIVTLLHTLLFWGELKPKVDSEPRQPIRIIHILCVPIILFRIVFMLGKSLSRQIFPYLLYGAIHQSTGKYLLKDEPLNI